MNSHELTRRETLGLIGGGFVAGAISTGTATSLSAREAENPKHPIKIVDCHAHIYSDDFKKYPTIDKPYSPPQGKGTIEHLRQQIQADGVHRVTAIHTSTYYRWDNRFTADASRDNADILVGVCTLNPDDPDSPDLLKKYVNEYNVRGMRSIAAQSGKLDDPGVARLWKTAEELGIVINVLTNRDKEKEILSLMDQHPTLRVVIDHCLNIVAGPELEPILESMHALSERPLAHAKLSYLPTGTKEEFPCRDMHDSCRRVIKMFTPQRCVWGSDFPCELWCPKVTYAQHLAIFTKELGLDDDAKYEILEGTPSRLWFGSK